MWPNGYGPKRNINNYNDPMPCYSDSDESDSDEMLPLGAVRPTPEEEAWTIVGKLHDVPRHAKDIDYDRLYVTRDKLDRSEMCCKQLGYIDGNVTRYDSERVVPERLVMEVNMLNTVDGDTRSEVLLIRRKEATQNNSSPSRNRNGQHSHRLTSEPVSTKVKPTIRKRPNVIAVETRKAAGVPAVRPVDMAPTPQVKMYENRCAGTISGGMFPEELKVLPEKMAKEADTEGPIKEQHLQDHKNYKKTTITKLPTDFVENLRPTIQRVSVQMAEEASTDGATNEQYLCDNQNCIKATSMKLPTDYVAILKPALPQLSVTVAEKASTDGATNKQCVYEVLDNNKTTTTKVSMDFLEIPQPAFTRGFLVFSCGRSSTTSDRNDEAGY